MMRECFFTKRDIDVWRGYWDLHDFFSGGGGGYENKEFMFSGQLTDNVTILFHVIFNR